MPIYEYECEKCGEVFEVSQSITADPLTKHNQADSSCKGKLTKLISSNAFHLKGGGWYKDGYSGSKKESAPAPACAAGGGCPSGGCPSAS
jgi:putative FmdB family regulatory protein